MVDTVWWQILLVALAGWVNRHQLEVIEYLREENHVLKGQLYGRPLRLTDAQRRRLASRGHTLGRAVLAQVVTLVTPDTILRWHRQLIARKWTMTRHGQASSRRSASSRSEWHGRIPTWGYRRIQGALRNLGHRVARSTIAGLLRDHGISPVPQRPTSWRRFLAVHWDAIAAGDFSPPKSGLRAASSPTTRCSSSSSPHAACIWWDRPRIPTTRSSSKSPGR